MNGPKEIITHNDAPDGQFICVMSAESREPAPGWELLEPEGGLSMLMNAAEGRAPKDVTSKARTLWQAAKEGFILSMLVAWAILEIIVFVLAVVGAALGIGYLMWWLTINY